MLYPDFDSAWLDWSDRWLDTYQPNMFDTSFFLDQARHDGFCAAGFNSLRNAIWGLYFALSILAGNAVDIFDNTNYNNLMWYAGKGGIDMRQVNDAMLDAEYLEISEYLGIQWAYQQTMWDQPFFMDKYVDIINRIRS